MPGGAPRRAPPSSCVLCIRRAAASNDDNVQLADGMLPTCSRGSARSLVQLRRCLPKSTAATCELVECNWTSTALNSREARECLTPDADSSARCSCDTIESDSILTCRSRQGSQVRVCQRRIAAAGVSVVWLARQPSDRDKPHWAVDSKRRTLFVCSVGWVGPDIHRAQSGRDLGCAS